MCLTPLPFGIVYLGKDNIKRPFRDFRILLTSGSNTQLTESHSGKRIGKNIIRLHQRLSLACQSKIPIVIPVVTVLFQKLGPLNGTIQPFLFLLHLIIEHGKHPHFPSLQPDKLIGIKHLSLPVQTGKISSELFILGILQPKRKHLIQKFRFILLS